MLQMVFSSNGLNVEMKVNDSPRGRYRLNLEDSVTDSDRGQRDFLLLGIWVHVTLF